MTLLSVPLSTATANRVVDYRLLLASRWFGRKHQLPKLEAKNLAGNQPGAAPVHNIDFSIVRSDVPPRPASRRVGTRKFGGR